MKSKQFVEAWKEARINTRGSGRTRASIVVSICDRHSTNRHCGNFVLMEPVAVHPWILG